MIKATYFGIVVTINFLQPLDEFTCNFGEVFETLQSIRKNNANKLLTKFLSQNSAKKTFKPRLLDSKLTTPWTSKMVVLESICLFAAIEQAGNLTANVFSKPCTWYFKYLSMVVTCISLLGSTLPSLSI